MRKIDILRKHGTAIDDLLQAGVISCEVQAHIEMFNRYEVLSQTNHPSPYKEISNSFKYTLRHTFRIMKQLRESV